MSLDYKYQKAILKARRDFWTYRKFINPKLKIGWWQEEIAGELQQFWSDYISGLRPKLVIQAPPQHGKSTQIVDFITWMIGQNQEIKTIYASFSDRLGVRANTKIKKILNSDAYHEIFPGVKVGTPYTQEIVGIGEEGFFRNTTVGGQITGESLDCLVAGTLINTSKGLIRIEELINHSLTCKILSYDILNKRLSYESLSNFTSHASVGIYRITTESGSILECTGDHRVFTLDNGYTEARKLSNGDAFVRLLPKGLHKTSLRCEQMAIIWSKTLLLFKRLPSKTQAYSNEIGKALQRLSMRITKTNRDLLQRLLKISKAKTFNNKRVSSYLSSMPDVQQSIQCKASRKWELCEILLKEMRGERPFKANVQQGESNVEAWSNPIKRAAAFCKSIQECAKTSIREGQLLLCNLFRNIKKIGSASYRQLAYEQCFIKFSNALRFSSCGNTQDDEGKFRTITDKVISVERVREQATTYDITVNKNHNFFANGILVHNCGIIDDPIKGREAANSETIRNKTWDWFTDDFSTRFADDGALLCILTRWHIDDPIGRLLEQDNAVKVLTYPAIATQDEPNRLTGEPLFPEHKSLGFLEALRARMASASWNSLFQQNPTLAEGNFFKPDFIQVVDALPAGLEFVRAWDLAATANGGDYTAGGKVAYDKANQVTYIADYVRGQWGPDDVEKILLATARSDGLRCKIRLPQDPGQAGKAQIRNLVKLLSGFSVIAETVSGDKETRASPVAAQVNIGNVYMLRGSWNRALIEELRLFPNGVNDDQVDTLADGFNFFTIKKIGSF